jgi:hypothetical protein
MSVTVRPYVNGGWEVDIRVQLPDGSVIRERKKAAASSKRVICADFECSATKRASRSRRRSFTCWSDGPPDART